MNSAYPETLPIPVSIPPAGTSSLPYNSYAANWENSKKGVLQQNKNAKLKQRGRNKDEAASFSGGHLVSYFDVCSKVNVTRVSLQQWHNRRVFHRKSSVDTENCLRWDLRNGFKLEEKQVFCICRAIWISLRHELVSGWVQEFSPWVQQPVDALSGQQLSARRMKFSGFFSATWIG